MLGASFSTAEASRIVVVLHSPMNRRIRTVRATVPDASFLIDSFKRIPEVIWPLVNNNHAKRDAVKRPRLAIDLATAVPNENNKHKMLVPAFLRCVESPRH